MFNKNSGVILVILLCFNLFLVSASLESLGTFKQSETVRITQVCSDATYINISSISYPNSTVAVSNIQMTSSGSGEYYYDFNSTDTSGRYDVRGVSDGCEFTFATTFEITLSGEQRDTTIIVSDIVLLLAVILIVLMIGNKHKETDFGSWNKKITDNHKNMGQTMVNSMLYALFKNLFIWYYFFGWILVLILKDIVYRFNSLEIYTYLKLIANVYSLGLLLVLVYMIGYTISYMRDTVGVLTDKNWGVNE
jgi:hypothetical protein